MGYETKNIRNICLLGHGGSGKTDLAEALLKTTSMIDRQGKIVDGNTVSDYDAEEIKRQNSISATTMYAKYKDIKINMIDAPGFFDFVGEVFQALRAADAGVIVGTAKDGIGVGGEKAWKYLAERKMPRMFFISKVDDENARYKKTLADLREKYGNGVCPMIAPIFDADSKVTGIVDLITREAFSIDAKGNFTESAPPAEMEAELEELYTAVNEAIAETSEAFMEKYFEGEAFTEEEKIAGLRAGIRNLTLFPVFTGSALTGLGVKSMLRAIGDLLPSPCEVAVEHGTLNGEPVEIACDPSGETCALVYKTVSDQYGKFSFFKVLSGKVTPDMTLTNVRTGTSEKMNRIYAMQGKKSEEVSEVICGDIGAVGKLTDTKTGDSLCNPKRLIAADGIAFPEPCYSMAISPKVKGQEDKVAAGLTRLREEDPSFSIVNNAETRQMVLSGAGDVHLDVLRAKLKSRFGVEVELSPAWVPYREKVRKKCRVQGKHKKQSGGSGQFGDVWVIFEPGETEEMTFEDKTVGGCVPKEYIPSVEKGLRESTRAGVLAGYPVVFLKATLDFGSSHSVDSSGDAFKMAAYLAYKAGLPEASPVLLEPIGTLEVTIPDANMGDIIGDLNKRRGRILGMNPSDDGDQIVEAEVPMAEMSSYAIDLRSMTQGRGTFTMKFARYEETPPNVQEKVIADTKARDEK
ncbi:MAG: elongation factor G [Oscillospiraceae bacterium]|nr:elongation factor G [Oscillospiraceae bacterium]